jgi:hypothetical protein
MRYGIATQKIFVLLIKTLSLEYSTNILKQPHVEPIQKTSSNVREKRYFFLFAKI